MSKSRENSKTGPKPDAVKIDVDWEDAVKKALRKGKPKEKKKK